MGERSFDRITGLQDYRITGLQDYRITGLQDYRIFPRSGNKISIKSVQIIALICVNPCPIYSTTARKEDESLRKRNRAFILAMKEIGTPNARIIRNYIFIIVCS